MWPCYETNASPTSSIDGVGGMVAEWLSLGGRPTLQSVSKEISCQLEYELERGVWDTLEDDVWRVLVPAHADVLWS